MTEISDDSAPRRWTPLPSGGAFLGLAVLVMIGRLFVHIPLPDIAAAAVPQHVASLRASASQSPSGVRVDLPQHWSFARHVRSTHSPQKSVALPRLGQVPIDVKRTVVFAAKRDTGTCAAILERAKVERSLDDDVAVIKQTVTENVYQR